MKKPKQKPLPLFDENNFSFELSGVPYIMADGELVIDNCSYERDQPFDSVYEVVIQYARLRHALINRRDTTLLRE